MAPGRRGPVQLNGLDNGPRAFDQSVVTLPSTPFSAPPPSGETRVQAVMRRVMQEIRGRRLKPGDDLPSETALSESLGVSRSAVREAFGALAALNIVDVGVGRRPRVSAVSGSVLAMSLEHAVSTEQLSLAQVWETRRCLETEIAGLAASRRTEEEAAMIFSIARAMRAAGPEHEKIIALDIALHQTIAAASHNLLMAQIIGSFQPLMESSVPKAWAMVQSEAQRDYIMANHLAVAQSILDKDPPAARQAMRDHFDRTVRMQAEDVR